MSFRNIADMQDKVLKQEILDEIAGGGVPVEVSASDITDATSVGVSVLTAADQAAARSAIGAGTSNLALGTTATTAKAGNYAPPAASTSVAGVIQIGTGATNAAAGNHTHTATNITATAIAPGTATNVQGILAELAARIAALEANVTP